MKKFITAISLQVEGPRNVVYKAAEGSNLQYDVPNAFPILAAMKNSVSEGENIEIVTILIHNSIKSDTVVDNYEIFKSQLNRLAETEHFKYSISHEIHKSDDDNYSTLIDVFSNLIECIDDRDDVYACITYGSKAVPMLTLMGLNYAYKVKKDVSVKKIVYGGIRWIKDSTVRQAEIYDVSPLFYIDSSLEYLAKMNLKNPEKALRMMIKQ